MYKWIYDKMMKEYKQESKEELAQRIMALSNIECKDRVFANECQSGAACYNLNELFAAVNTLQENLSKLLENAEKAKGSWQFIRNGLASMNNATRCGTELYEFKKRVDIAKRDSDEI